MGFVSGISNAVMFVPNCAGSAINWAVDGQWGVGAWHKGLIPVASYCLQSRPAMLGAQAVLPVLGYDYKDWKKNPLSAVTVVSVLGLIVYSLHLTHFLSRPLTGEMTKQILTRAVLSTLDTYALYQATKQPVKQTVRQNYRDVKVIIYPSKLKKFIAGTYLSMRALDILVNYGGVTEGLMRFNTQPLHATIGRFKSW